jgi:hypothetical protein
VHCHRVRPFRQVSSQVTSRYPEFPSGTPVSLGPISATTGVLAHEWHVDPCDEQVGYFSFECERIKLRVAIYVQPNELTIGVSFDLQQCVVSLEKLVILAGVMNFSHLKTRHLRHFLICAGANGEHDRVLERDGVSGSDLVGGSFN